MIQVRGNRLARVVAHNCYAAARLARCRDEFRCPVSGLGCCHCLGLQQGQLPLGTLAYIPATSSDDTKDFQRV